MGNAHWMEILKKMQKFFYCFTASYFLCKLDSFRARPIDYRPVDQVVFLLISVAQVTTVMSHKLTPFLIFKRIQRSFFSPMQELVKVNLLRLFLLLVPHLFYQKCLVDPFCQEIWFRTSFLSKSQYFLEFMKSVSR